MRSTASSQHAISRQVSDTADRFRSRVRFAERSRDPAERIRLQSSRSAAASTIRLRSESSEVLKVTETRGERESAFRLVHDVYCESGLIAPDPMGLRVMRHHLSDDTEVLIAKRNGQVSFTLTLVRDAEFGLPLDSLFADEVDDMRARGVRLAEVSCLATRGDLLDKKARFEMFVRMISLTLQTARRRGVQRLLLAVHPRHAKVYQRLFGCVRCSDVKEYAAVQGNPAVLCMHDFAALDRTRYPLFDQIYGPNYDPWQMDGSRMTEAEKCYFESATRSKAEAFIPMAA